MILYLTAAELTRSGELHAQKLHAMTSTTRTNAGSGAKKTIPWPQNRQENSPIVIIIEVTSISLAFYSLGIVDGGNVAQTTRAFAISNAQVCRLRSKIPKIC